MFSLKYKSLLQFSKLPNHFHVSPIIKIKKYTNMQCNTLYPTAQMLVFVFTLLFLLQHYTCCVKYMTLEWNSEEKTQHRTNIQICYKLCKKLTKYVVQCLSKIGVTNYLEIKMLVDFTNINETQASLNF
jgi:hypothetical protein